MLRRHHVLSRGTTTTTILLVTARRDDGFPTKNARMVYHFWSLFPTDVQVVDCMGQRHQLHEDQIWLWPIGCVIWLHWIYHTIDKGHG